MTERLHFHFSFSCIGEGNGNPLQYSCLENPTDGGAWWATVHRVAKSRTRLNDFTFTMPYLLPKEIKPHTYNVIKHNKESKKKEAEKQSLLSPSLSSKFNADLPGRKSEKE